MTAMVDIELHNLDGAALHWVVAKIEGVDVELVPPHYGAGWRIMLVSTGSAYRPTEDWHQCGQLMDKYCKSFGMVTHSEPPRFRAFAHDGGPEGFCRIAGGDSIRVAFCRAIARLHHGDTIQIPQVLAPQRISAPADAA